ncbi:MAG: hypothetical protein ACTHMM_27020 [Agriterribacter sp.]
MIRYIFYILEADESSQTRYCLVTKLPITLFEGDYFEFTKPMFKEMTIARQSINPTFTPEYIKDIGEQIVFGKHDKAVQELVIGRFALVVNTRPRIDKEGMYIETDIRIVDSKNEK